MFDYHLTVVAQLSHREPLAYSMAPRTVPTLVSRFTNPRPPVQNGTTPILAAARPNRGCSSPTNNQLILACRRGSVSVRLSP